MKLPGKQPRTVDCADAWGRLGSAAPSTVLEGHEMNAFIHSLKAWDGSSELPSLPLLSGLPPSAKIQVLVTGSVYLVGDVLSVCFYSSYSYLC